MNRRKFLSLTALTAASLTVAKPGFANTAVAETPSSFDFIFLTDTHIQPELNAAQGCTACFKQIRAFQADFAIHGGDHVFDVLGVNRQRAVQLYDLYGSTEQELGLKIHHTLGNHDVFAVYPRAGVGTADPGYGKRMYEARIGPAYYSFDHKGYHFLVLDSIQIVPARIVDRPEPASWEARIDAGQLAWIAKDLGGIRPQMPVIVIVHVPLVTGASSYAPPRGGKENQASVMNAYEVLPLFAGHNVLAVLQGHTHINEVVTFQNTPYATRGAVCGNWWHGSRWGTPEGFTVVSLRGGKIDWRYETYGFRTVDPQNT
jgi:3',5'-cyclic AMP phosphodiesterase CpdA